MQMNQITPDYTVSPQIALEDIPQIADAGFKTVLCNRPDAENPANLHIAAIREAVENAGLAFVENPFPSPMMTMEHVEKQSEILATVDGPVFAYCASGTRCSVVWSMVQAGHMETDAILAAIRGAGYNLDGLRPQIDALASARKNTG